MKTNGILKSAMIWFGSVMGIILATVMLPILGTKAEQLETLSSGSGDLVYQSGSLSVIHRSAPDYIDTEGNVFEMGSLTIKSGDISITILDRNLGATQTGTSCPDYNSGACGYFFQWGNNYGFGKMLTKIYTGRVDTSDYLWDNPYVSDTFVISPKGSIFDKDNSRGGSGDTTNSQTNPDYMRQGPCPEGYHVPTYSEISVFKILAESGLNTANTKFYIPFAGWRDAETLDWLGNYGFYWSSSPKPNGALARYVDFGADDYGDYVDLDYYNRDRAFSIRCFANDDNDPTVTLSFNTMGGTRIGGQTVPVGGTAHVIGYDPKNEGYEFGGWYLDSGYTQPFVFGETILNGDTTVYAKWIKDIYSYEFRVDDDIVSSGTIEEGDLLTKPVDPMKMGLAFVGWYTSEGRYNFANPVLGNLELRAEFTGSLAAAVHAANQDEDTDQNIILVGGTTIENDTEENSTGLFAEVTTDEEKDSLIANTGVQILSTTSGDETRKLSLISENKDEDAVEELNNNVYLAVQDSGVDVEVQGGLEVFVKEQTIYSGSNEVIVKKSINTVQFSKPIAVPIPVKSDNISKVKVKVKHAGDEQFGYNGLTLNWNANCDSGLVEGADKYNGEDVEVSNGYAWIYTCSASTFVAYTEEKVDNTPVSSNGGHSRRNNADETEVEEVKVTISEHAKSIYNQEQLDAYKWAYSKGITTIDDADEARLSDPLTRAELAKMMSQYILAVLDRQPGNTGEVSYPDVDDSMGDLASFVKVAYRYGIMGINPDGTPLDIFRPYEVVTRAHLATVFSRVLFGNRFDKLDGNYYEDHINNLNKAGILNNTNPKMQEIRGWVMLMMYRSAK